MEEEESSESDGGAGDGRARLAHLLRVSKRFADAPLSETDHCGSHVDITILISVTIRTMPISPTSTTYNRMELAKARRNHSLSELFVDLAVHRRIDQNTVKTNYCNDLCSCRTSIVHVNISWNETHPNVMLQCIVVLRNCEKRATYSIPHKFSPPPRLAVQLRDT